MRKSSVAVVATFLFFSVAAHAGSIQTYTITQGSAVIDINPLTLSPEVFFSFSGSGFSIGGFGQTDLIGNFLPPGYGPLSPSLVIFTDPSDGGLASGTIGGVFYPSLLFNSSIPLTSGPSFNVPSGNQSAFSIKLPITFSGTAGACAFDPTTQSCSANLANFNFNAKGTATINYINQGGLWFNNSATFTLSPVPEPGTFMLMGSGLTALVGFVRRRRF